MRLRLGILCCLVLSVACFTAFSLLRGQDRPLAPSVPPVVPSPLAPPRIAAPAAPGAPSRDFSKLTQLQKDMLLSARRGAEWLCRMNTVKGRFIHGLEPSLPEVVPDGDNYLRQAGAAFALARAARYFGEDRYTARATQTVLTLLDETAVDPKDPQVRCTSLPSPLVNRLGAAGLLVLAINELPDPQADLLEESEQLCNYIRRQGRPDGSLACLEAADGKAAAEPVEAVNAYPGVALYALMRSQKRRPAAWKTELVRKAVGYYRPWWQAHKNMDFVPWQTAACTEAYLLTRDQAFADFAFEMNDWLCGLQYGLDPQHELWMGGFKGWVDGRPAETPPTITTAFYAEGLADACRAARQAADLDRYQRYQGDLVMGLQFTTRLQYTEADNQFADWYRPRLVGGFHASARDGVLRIDYSQHALSALLQYLDADLR